MLNTCHSTDTRKNPQLIIYHGLPLYVRLEYSPNGNEISKVVVSYREKKEKKAKRNKKDYGKPLWERKYSPAVKTGAEDEIIEKTLEDVIPTKFLPSLFGKMPELMTPDLPCALLLPYALERQNSYEAASLVTKQYRQKALEDILTNWGDLPISQLTPERCAPVFLNKMSKDRAEHCIALIRQLTFKTHINQVASQNATLWANYSMPGRRTRSSLVADNRRNTMPAVFTENQISAVFNKCVRGITDKKEGNYYLAALIMLLTRMSVEEICAFNVQSIKKMKEYDAYFARIETQLETQGGKRVRYYLKKIADQYQSRTVVFGDLVMRFLKPMIKNKTGFLLCHPQNHDRRLSPDVYKKWLDDTFKEQIGEVSVLVGNKKIESKKTVIDYFMDSSSFYHFYFGLREEELQRFEGHAPQHTDAQHYVDFICESELLSLVELQNRWIAFCLDPTLSVEPDIPQKQKGREYIAATNDKTKKAVLRAKITIPGNVDGSSVIELLCPYGAQISIKSKEIDCMN